MNAVVSTEPLQELTVDIDIRLKTPNALSNEHHYARATRRKREQETTLKAFAPYEPPTFDDNTKLTITLTRLGPVPLDSDNLAYSFKAVRDAIAKWLGIDDNDQRLTWDYRQEKVRERCRVKAGRYGSKAGLRVWARACLTMATTTTQKT